MAYNVSAGYYLPNQWNGSPTMPGGLTAYPWNSGYANNATQQNRIIGVTGIEGAKAYSRGMPPNAKDIVFDENEDIFYLIATDAGGFPTIKDFDFSPRQHEENEIKSNPDYVTKDMLEKFKADLDSDFNSLKEKLDAISKNAVSEAPSHAIAKPTSSKSLL